MAPRFLALPLGAFLLALATAQPFAPAPGAPQGGDPAPARDEVTTAARVVAARAFQAAGAGAAVSAEEVRQHFAKADLLRRVGDPRGALGIVQPLAAHPDRGVAAEAAYRVAQLRLELGLPVEAIGDLQSLLARSPDAALANRATFLLAIARRQAGDCAGAIESLTKYVARTDLLASHADFQVARCYQQAGDAGAALARTDQVLQQSESRRLQIEALELQGAVLEKAGDAGSAVARYERLVDLARDRGYKADMRLTAARLHQELGQNDSAAAQLAAVVIESPSTRTAAAALDRLVALGATARVSYYQAGLARYYARDYAAAIRNFDGALGTPAEAANHPAAMYFRAASRVRQGAEVDAARELLALPGSFPASRYAPDALVRGGKVLESNERFGEAAQAYRRAASDYPDSPFASEALFRLGVVNLLRSAPDEAGAAWGELGEADVDAEGRALGLLWAGKLARWGGDDGGARAAWQRAVDLGPSWYGGLRARGLLEPAADPLARPRALDPGRVALNGDELAELDTWLSARGGGLAALQAEQGAEPALARADELLALGMRAEAAWELDDLAVRYAQDPARLVVLALALHQRGLDYQALLQTQAALSTAKVALVEAPAAIQKLLYPLPYGEVFTGQAARYGVNPLLFASLVRQESHFDPLARSSANAIGLTQVVPPTAREIANALGRTDFKTDDLYRPNVSLEFGAFYFGQRLKRFGGAVFPALAAYNAGDGAVDGWIRTYGLDDPDTFAERIPYAETNHYVKVIFENYGVYQALYGAR